MRLDSQVELSPHNYIRSIFSTLTKQYVKENSNGPNKLMLYHCQRNIFSNLMVVEQLGFMILIRTTINEFGVASSFYIGD
jgi:hypothetical protein